MIAEEDKQGCGDCHKLLIEIAEVKLELAMLFALIDRSELTKKDFCKNSVSTTTLMKCATVLTKWLIHCHAQTRLSTIN